MYGCVAGAHVRAPSAQITAGIASDLTEDEINALLWDASCGLDATWGGWGDLHDSLLRKGYLVEGEDGMAGLTPKGVDAATELFAARRRALDGLACTAVQVDGSDGVSVGQAVISDRFNGADWEEIADALGVTIQEAYDIYVTYV
ncbi:MAG TPA: hypothetical protein VGO80_10965 [Solirubrobacteraceae bacterium]|jgi:hypothetical protein|nr:hypothetical protein [Solirubrobacteraceae bacterium]